MWPDLLQYEDTDPHFHSPVPLIGECTPLTLSCTGCLLFFSRPIPMAQCIPRLRSRQEVERTPRSVPPGPRGPGDEGAHRIVECSSASSRLRFGVRLPREGEAPAEPLWRGNVVPGSRLSRSFALPSGHDSTPIPRLDEALGDLAGRMRRLLSRHGSEKREMRICRSTRHKSFLPLGELLR